MKIIVIFTNFYEIQLRIRRWVRYQEQRKNKIFLRILMRKSHKGDNPTDKEINRKVISKYSQGI